MKTGRIIPAWTAALAAAVLALCLLALPAGAAEADSGTCGDNLTWVLDSSGTLTISGSGDMTDWGTISGVSWYSCKEEITEVVIEDGVTSIGDYAFHCCISLESITIPDSVTSIGDRAFYQCYALESITIPEAVTSIGTRAFYYCTALTTIVFSGGAPEIAENAFTKVTADAYYPEDDSSWTEEAMQDYGGSLNWTSYGSGTEEFVSCSFALYSGTEELSSAQLASGSTVDLDAAAAPEKEGYTLAGWVDRDCTLYNGEITITGDLSLYAAWTPEEGTLSEDGTLLISLDNEEISYIGYYYYTTDMQIACEERNGFYILEGSTLGFYSLDYFCYMEVYSFDSINGAYSTGDRLYVLDRYDFQCYVYDLVGNELEATVSLEGLEDEETVSDTTAIGVDSSGRLYVATSGTVEEDSVYTVWLCSPDGTLLSSTEVENLVYSFDGFEEESGYFFMESSYNWIYFGYDHYGHGLTMGIVENDTISYVDSSSSGLTQGVLVLNYDCLEYLCQNTYYRHQTSAALLGGHYLVTTSVTNGRIQVIDTETFDTLLSISRTAIEEAQSSTTIDYNSIGVRAVYHESNDSIILYENGKILNEYDPETGEIIGSYETACYVFNLLIMGDQVIAIEKEDGEYCLEIVDWSTPEEFEIQAESDTMQVGESQQLTAEGSAYSTSYTWSSSDETILSVTDNGLVSAWSEGEATITYTSLDGSYEAEYTIQVSGTLADSEPEAAILLSGEVSDNLSDNNISTYYSRTVNSYLYENEDGTLTRVEYVSGTGVLVEVLDPSDGSTLSSMTLDMELPIWGGFYSGEEYNYLVFGQMNSDEDDDVEVIRVVKYSRDWERIDECSICGANTYEPFEAGSLRMTEADGTLYVYTCHTMYGDGGTNHQANMTFVIDEDSMEVTDSYYDVMNISYGYVSHSFNQFIQTDGEYLYRVDLGDGYPRAVVITKSSVDDDVTDLTAYTEALEISGGIGVNATGVSVGGFELSTDNCLIVGNSVDQDSDDYSAYGQRNIFLLVADQDYLETEVIWLTDYEESDGITPRTPQLVKITDDQFLLLWEEEDSSGEITTRMVTLNGDGDLTSDIITSDVRLSDCQPIVTEDRIVTWYVTDGETAILYQLNPYSLEDYESVDIPAGSEEDAGSEEQEEEQDSGSDSAGGSDSEDSGSSSGGSDSSDSGSGADENSTEEDSSGGSQDSGSDEDGSVESEDSSDDAGESSGYSSGYLACLQDGTCPICQFTDADPTAWYHDGVHFCIENGLMNGTSTTTFEPGTATTRSMIVTMLYRLAGSPEVSGSSGFSDVEPGSWYEDAVIWAEQNEIANGYDNGEFGVSDNVTREQLAAFFYRYAENILECDMTAAADLSDDDYEFMDVDEVSSWAETELSWAVAKGLISGQSIGGKTYLAPGSDAARCETATILMRFMTSFITE